VGRHDVRDRRRCHVKEQLLEHSPAVHIRRPKISRSPSGSASSAPSSARSRPGRPVRRQRPRPGVPARPQRPAGRRSLWRRPERPRARQRPPHPAHRWQGQPASADPARYETRTMRAIDSAVGERNDGPLLARGDGSRLDRHAAGRIVRRLAKRAGIDKAISPHSLRHAAIAAALDAGWRSTSSWTSRLRMRATSAASAASRRAVTGAPGCIWWGTDRWERGTVAPPGLTGPVATREAGGDRGTGRRWRPQHLLRRV
jgi:hypothetical protein